MGNGQSSIITKAVNEQNSYIKITVIYIAI